MNKTILGYVPEESPIYRTHPFVRVFFLLVVSLFPMCIAAPEWNFILVILVILLMRYSRIDLATLRFYVPVSMSMGSIILISYILVSGHHPEFIQLASLGPIRIYFERIRDAIVVYLRVLPMIFITVFFLSTSRERDIIVAMRSIRVPFVITYLTAMALRAAGMVMEDFSIVRQAEQARGYDPVGKPIAYKLKQWVMYMVPLFALSLRRADEFSNALVARGYNFTGVLKAPKRADYVLTHYRFHASDAAIIILLSGALVALMVLRYRYGYFTLEGSLTSALLHRWLLR